MEALRQNGVEYQDDYTKRCVSNEALDDRFTRSIGPVRPAERRKSCPR